MAYEYVFLSKLIHEPMRIELGDNDDYSEITYLPIYEHKSVQYFIIGL